MTIVYISRHSQPFRKLLGEYKVNEIEQIRNEKNPLSVDGEKYADQMSNYPELSKVESLYSSHYVRAMATAKYIAEKNNIVLNIDERLGERKFGVDNMSELPANFFEEQFRNWDYKLPNGEKVIAIISHGTAISTMLKKWCDIKLNEEKKLIEIYFNNELVFDGDWKCPELFKAEFDDNNDLISIKNIQIKI